MNVGLNRNHPGDANTWTLVKNSTLMTDQHITMDQRISILALSIGDDRYLLYITIREWMIHCLPNVVDETTDGCAEYRSWNEQGWCGTVSNPKKMDKMVLDTVLGAFFPPAYTVFMTALTVFFVSRRHYITMSPHLAMPISFISSDIMYTSYDIIYDYIYIYRRFDYL